ncbi:hypothetical protein [Actinokineospora sp. UTMC 2448]|uniref:hypothetical protein n=1 Tax=Actinokineospora sp. UTMC 2448 TaxID=2268449 RepID=UPI002164B82A|nr:hypothetical protein [Actinokineospora sp. UTMC 2448]UVS78169.1 hypothetical protein Actkin_01893 [Actinokineospora sp. UTMC 2448]
MIRKALAVAAVAALGAAPASAQTEPQHTEPAGGPSAPVLFLGTQDFCEQAGLLGQGLGLLPEGGWQCQDGLMSAAPPAAIVPAIGP